ncbi:uncharacterized protein FPOAC1_013540 [Fusarium poae]|uniref:uncharacterized protein n=1 Tax=Fusarium poae TaxID=36050 RepID=UPI001D04B64E|nr:uncharacterized protein FPOAC1_013477 [Fusarium poae]XP_044701210.1 uncharacterized protein FPOAC1_013487 [Fusarium poae]XP_044701263.1 uncharacterized protein FPOAC1_013540 [Fusarium poae]KAG8664697.1 hypothetical protein FPOAC1_013477 [Fusarium poae]KAG8664707.1 hypothetical protein FPOAC1_013487 [Fusarium poae]KAG8664760.1 hypothetical protein FPOAC1_013540 [Fusarium poae]
MLYDSLKRREADVLSQLRAGMARINSYLSKIGAEESDILKLTDHVSAAEDRMLNT